MFIFIERDAEEYRRKVKRTAVTEIKDSINYIVDLAYYHKDVTTDQVQFTTKVK